MYAYIVDSDDPNRTAKEHADDAANELRSRDRKLVSDLHAIGLRCAALLKPGAICGRPRGPLVRRERSAQVIIDSSAIL